MADFRASGATFLAVALTLLTDHATVAISIIEPPPRIKIESTANEAFWKRDYNSAKNSVEVLLQDKSLPAAYRARCLVNLSICEAQLDDWTQARKDAAEAAKLADSGSLTAADAAMIEARCLLLADKVEQAKTMYEKAISTIVRLQGPWSTDLAPFYEGLAGCFVYEKNYSKAETAYQKVAQLDLLKYGPDDTHFAWSLLSLGSVAKDLKNEQLNIELYKKVFWNFRHQNELRIIDEYKDLPDQDKLIATLRQHLYGNKGAYNDREVGLSIIKEGIPADAYNKPIVREKTFDNWFKERVGRERAPGLAFFDPTKPLKGIIVTVHGLGLHGGAFAPFAERVQHEGYGIVSFDVRGFGSYRNDEVYQQLNLQASVKDISRVLSSLRADYDNCPLILLGESMGGAIVLRVAAEHPELVDAVISSVPSGSRYKGRKTAFRVGFNFLKHRHRQFDIGSSIVSQATDNADLRDMWEGDPNVRLKLSPAELLNFQKFMGENVKAAANITKTPVIIYQGYSDNLVKPMGTLAIYQAIPNKDKDMIFLGRAEHLIFEEGQTDPIVLHNVVEWMNRHLPPKGK
ncbi:MAG: alpha/beta fold hydrolase [Cyanobacteria bacterium REEB67]|nr:alpha/beta fold hydrolase [Cyanobacteria bacterium REEB67]